MDTSDDGEAARQRRCEELERQLAEQTRKAEYFQKQASQLAGRAFSADSSNVKLRLELEQRRRGFTLLAQVVTALEAGADPNRVFITTCHRINGTLNMERTVVLSPESPESERFRPSVWRGYDGAAEAALRGTQPALPRPLLDGRKPLLITGDTACGAEEEALRTALGLPFLVGVPVVAESRVVAALFTGRTREENPYLPRLNDGDVETLVAIAGFLGAAVSYMRKIEVERAHETLRVEHERAMLSMERSVQKRKMDALGQLVAGMAHELNTPLGIALTSVSMLADQTAGLATLSDEGRLRRSDLQAYLETAGSAAGMAQKAVERAIGLVGTFKQVAADRTPDERKAFDLAACVRDLLSTQLGPVIEEAGHRWTLDGDGPLGVEGYPEAVRQVLASLVANSLDHAFPGGRRGEIRIAVRADGPDRVRLEHADDGAGIAAAHLDKVFDPFFTTGRGEGRAGLGLHIAFNLVTEVLGGEIAADSRPGQGARFTLTLPRRAPEAPAAFSGAA